MKIDKVRRHYAKQYLKHLDEYYTAYLRSMRSGGVAKAYREYVEYKNGVKICIKPWGWYLERDSQGKHYFITADYEEIKL